MAELFPVGPASWLIELPADVTAGGAAQLARHLGRRRDAGDLPGVVDIVPGARTVLLDCASSSGPDRDVLLAAVAGWSGPTQDGESGDVVEIPVRYDGPDLDGVAELAGLCVDEVVARHTGAELTVAFCGFAPGFAYLTGLPDELRVPRLDEPRTAVPAGSVAVAEEYAAVYPLRSPGGWRILGRTDLALWDETRTPPARLRPGGRVRFRAV